MYFDDTSGGRDLAAIERALLDVSFQTSFICREPTLNNIYPWQVIYLGTLETILQWAHWWRHGEKMCSVPTLSRVVLPEAWMTYT